MPSSVALHEFAPSLVAPANWTLDSLRFFQPPREVACNGVSTPRIKKTLLFQFFRDMPFSKVRKRRGPVFSHAGAVYSAGKYGRYTREKK
jgi:hypothetical protein